MATSPPPPPEAKSFEDTVWSLWIDRFKDEPAEYQISAMRQTEYDQLQADDANVTSASIADQDKAFKRIYTETWRYIKFFLETWRGLLVSFVVGGISWYDFITMLVYAVGGTVVLALMLPFCLLAGSKDLREKFCEWWKYFGNSYLREKFCGWWKYFGNPYLFKRLTKEQLEAAFDFLSGDIKTDYSKTNHPKSNTSTDYKPWEKRVFSLDAAKLFVQLSAIMYEFRNEPLRGRLRTLDKEARERRNVKVIMVETQSGFIPWLWRHFKAIVDPHNIPILSVLLFDPIAYGRAKVKPLTLPQHEDEDLNKVEDSIKDEADAAATINRFCKQYKIQYQTLSHLGDTSSAVSGLFWAQDRNWVVVVFKGTSPVEYGEWISNFDTKLAPIGSHISGFKRVHKGFKERVFPGVSSRYKLPYRKNPYDTICFGIQSVVRELAKHPKNTAREINVWFTGHSLGCSTAALVYSRLLDSRWAVQAVRERGSDGPSFSLRDAYLFGAPVLCDGESVEVFNSKMSARLRRSTMWRITNSEDFVATCLPDFGDRRNISVSANNAFALAHLGTEIKLRDAPLKCQVTGNHLQYGTSVEIKSIFTDAELVDQFNESLTFKNTKSKFKKSGESIPYNDLDKNKTDPAEVNRLWWSHAAQQLPFPFGRLFAHIPVNYVDQLDRVALGECEWVG